MGAWHVIMGIYGGGISLPDALNKEGVGFTLGETLAFTFRDGKPEFGFVPGQPEYTFRDDDPA